MEARAKGGEWEQWGQAIMHSMVGRVFLEGLLYFMIYHIQKSEVLIVGVDREGKACRFIRWHDKHLSEPVTFIGQSQGHLHCISVNLQFTGFDLHMTQLSVWVLEDYDTQE